jgi:Fe-S-cluster containining protein
MIEMTKSAHTESSDVQEHGEPQIAAGGNGEYAELLEGLRQEVTRGFLYANSRANHNTGKALQVASFCYALIELLEEKGILTVGEVDDRKKLVADRLVKKFKDEGMGAVYQDPECDKYSFDKEVEIDCEQRVHLCKAACCRIFSFALSKQDIAESVLKWDLGYPYMVAKCEDGYCKHLNRATYRCRVQEHRPVPCRAFDCRKDGRIWLNFEKKVLNPKLSELLENSNLRPSDIQKLTKEEIKGSGR